MKKRAWKRPLGIFLATCFGGLGVFLFAKSVTTAPINTLGAIGGIVLFSIGFTGEVVLLE